jgi:diacylglycerol kinase (ATP)
MSRRFIYIINPISGTRKKKDLQDFLEAETRKHDIPYDVYPSVANGDYRFLLPSIKKNKVTDIIIAGGDGTVSQVVHSLRETQLNFGIIPCGSGNGLALAAGISRTPSLALKTIMQGAAQLTDGFIINKQFSCMLCGLGFDARVAHDFAKQAKRGLSTYVQQVIKNFFSAKAYRFELKFENNSLDTEAFFISIANSNQFGNNFTIAPSASLNDGLLDIVIATHQNKFSLLLQTFKQITGRNKVQHSGVVDRKQAFIYFQAEKLTIHNPSMAPLHIDGDPVDTYKKLEIEVWRDCFKLLRPV